jgi:hypothetical protein
MPSGAIVTRVDHIFFNTDQVEEIFDLFTRTLSLPVAWPVRDYGPFASGGVRLGAMNLEIARGASTGLEPSPRFGIAFAPKTLATSLAELAKRDIPHGRGHPISGPGPDGRPAVLWTTVAIEGMLDGADVFLCDYSPMLRPPGTTLLPMPPAGPLGVTSVEEVRIGVPDFDAAARRWGTLLMPLEPSASGYWRPVGGPAIRLVSASQVTIVVVLMVRSRVAAETFLRERGLFGEPLDGMAVIDPIHTNGILFAIAG